MDSDDEFFDAVDYQESVTQAVGLATPEQLRSLGPRALDEVERAFVEGLRDSEARTRGNSTRYVAVRVPPDTCQFVTPEGVRCTVPARGDLRLFLNAAQAALAHYCHVALCADLLQNIEKIVSNVLIPTAFDRIGTWPALRDTGAGRTECCRVCGLHLHVVKVHLLGFAGMQLLDQVWTRTFGIPGLNAGTYRTLLRHTGAA